jgi:SAM-dependent methyltransferase
MNAWFPPNVRSETVPCDRCGSSADREVFEGPDRLHGLPGWFRLVACPRCGWLRQNPRPTAETLAFYYPEDYANFIPAIEDESRRWRRWDRRYGMLKRRWAVERLQPCGRLLDVGCATGAFLHEMQLSGWQAEGVEPNPGAASYARRRHGLEIYPGTLRAAGLPSGRFNVITLWDVLEHVPNPWADLVEAHRLLAGSGLLVLRVPNLESLEARWFGKYWLGWDLPRHLYFFPRQVLFADLTELGFRIERASCLATGHSAFMLDLKFYLDDRFPPPARLPGIVQRYGYSVPARLALAPFFWALGQVRASSMITVFARKAPSSAGAT